MAVIPTGLAGLGCIIMISKLCSENSHPVYDSQSLVHRLAAGAAVSSSGPRLASCLAVRCGV